MNKKIVTPNAVEVAQPKTDNRKLKTIRTLSFSINMSIAQKENLSLEEVQSIPGSGTDGRFKKVMFLII